MLLNLDVDAAECACACAEDVVMRRFTGVVHVFPLIVERSSDRHGAEQDDGDGACAGVAKTDKDGQDEEDVPIGEGEGVGVDGGVRQFWYSASHSTSEYGDKVTSRNSDR